MEKIDYLKEGQKCYLHKAGSESQVFEYGTEKYEEAIEGGWTHAVQAVPEPIEETEEKPMLFDDENIVFYRKKTLLEVVGVFENGDIFAQNEGDTSDRWRIPKETFESTYELAEDTKEEEVISTGFETIDLSNQETIDAQLKGLELFSLRTLCVELEIEGMEKANGATCIKRIKEFAAKGGEDE